MFVIRYRYPVPEASAAALVELQERVARLYFEAGCRRYLVLRPQAAGEPWTELTFFDSRAQHQQVEERLSASSTLHVLFAEFLRLTGAAESDLTPTEYHVAFQAGMG